MPYRVAPGVAVAASTVGKRYPWVSVVVFYRPTSMAYTTDTGYP
jgi:hypothetical protein